MAHAVTEIFDTTIQKTITWFDELSDLLGWDDPHKTYLALRSVLHVLRDRLTVQEAADLAAQFPMLIRGLYYEGWRPAGKPTKLHTKEEFLSAVCSEFPAGCDFDPDKAVRAVFKLLENKVSRGEIEDIRQNMPKDLLDWWT